MPQPTRSSSSTRPRRTARRGGGGPSSRGRRPRPGSRGTRSSASGPVTSPSSRGRRRSAERSCSSSSAATARCNEVANGLAGLGRQPEIALVPRGTGWDFSRTFGSRGRSTRRRGSRSRARRARSISARLVPRLGRLGRDGGLRERRQRRDERRDRQASERDHEGARRQGVLPVGDLRGLLRLAGERDRGYGRRRAPGGSHVRCRRRQRPLLRRRARDLPRRRARRRHLRRPHDRGRHEARPRADRAEDVPRDAPAASQGGAPARRHRDGDERHAAPGRARRRAARHDARHLRGDPARAHAPRATAHGGVRLEVGPGLA